MIAIFPEIRAAAARGDLEGLSILVRKYFADTEKYKPIVNIEQLVEKMGRTSGIGTCMIETSLPLLTA